MVGVVLAFGASRLGKEGVGDLDSAAWWVTPVLAAAAGFVAPAHLHRRRVRRLELLAVARQPCERMVVNAVAFFVLARPVTRLARRVGRRRRAGPPMKGSWRDRPSGSRFSRLWRPGDTAPVSRQGPNRSTNPSRSAFANSSPRRVRSSCVPNVAGSIGGFFFILFLLLVGRLYVLQVKDHTQSSDEVASNAIRKVSIPASRGLILDRTGSRWSTTSRPSRSALARRGRPSTRRSRARWRR